MRVTNKAICQFLWIKACRIIDLLAKHPRGFGTRTYHSKLCHQNAALSECRQLGHDQTGTSDNIWKTLTWDSRHSVRRRVTPTGCYAGAAWVFLADLARFSGSSAIRSPRFCSRGRIDQQQVAHVNVGLCIASTRRLSRRSEPCAAVSTAPSDAFHPAATVRPRRPKVSLAADDNVSALRP